MYRKSKILVEYSELKSKELLHSWCPIFNQLISAQPLIKLSRSQNIGQALDNVREMLLAVQIALPLLIKADYPIQRLNEFLIAVIHDSNDVIANLRSP
jgi:hypothetical protein